MTEPEFLQLEAVMLMHDEALASYGGIPGVKQPGLLESALARPLNKMAYEPEDSFDLIDLAAAYAFGIARNHPFNDANKRTAWSACVLFLKTNGYAVSADAELVAEQVVQLASGSVSEQEFSVFLHLIAAPLPSPSP